MGWKGTLRSIQAAQRRAERDARRRHRELQSQQKQLEKMQGLKRAIYEVQVYENYLDVLLSVHKECGSAWDWESIHIAEPPVKPSRSKSQELAAQADLDGYKPGVINKF